MGYFNGKNEPENGFTIEDIQAEAEEKLRILRALIADFVDEDDNEPLSVSELRTASRTPLEYLETGAELCEAAGVAHQMPPRTTQLLRLTEAGDALFEAMAAHAEELADQIRAARTRRKLLAIPVARLAHRIARLIVETGAGDWLVSYVEHMKAILARPSHKKEKKEKVKNL